MKIVCGSDIVLNPQNYESKTAETQRKRGKICKYFLNLIYLANKRFDVLPADGDGQRLRGAGAGTDDLWPQTFGLEDVEERIAGRNRP